MKEEFQSDIPVFKLGRCLTFGLKTIRGVDIPEICPLPHTGLGIVWTAPDAVEAVVDNVTGFTDASLIPAAEVALGGCLVGLSASKDLV